MYRDYTYEVWGDFRFKFWNILKGLILPTILLILTTASIGAIAITRIKTGNNGLLELFGLGIFGIASFLIWIAIIKMTYASSIKNRENYNKELIFLNALNLKGLIGLVWAAIRLSFMMFLTSLLFVLIPSTLTRIITKDELSINLIVIAIGTILTIVVFARAIIMLASSSIGKKLSFFESMKLTKDFKLFSVYAVLVLPLLFSIVIFVLDMAIAFVLASLPNEVQLIILVIVGALVFCTTTIFNIMCIGVFYRYIIEENIEPDESEQIEETKIETKSLD